MRRRTFCITLPGLAAAAGASAQSRATAAFTADWRSLERHKVPQWYSDAKLGIFIHWGLYSVPAWAPTSGELGKVPFSRWFIENAYAEWYFNSLRLKDSPTYKHHAAKYGADFDYYRFASDFEAGIRNWKPEAWAALFKNTHAQYVVLTTKHHDGFTLWPSGIPNTQRPGQKLSASRDLVGELTTAVRGAGLKMGLYYSGGLDWTFESRPVANFGDLMTTAPQSEEYARYAEAHWRELIERYKPSAMWNDIGYPSKGRVQELFAYYYNNVPEGVINNRFSVPWADFTTPEYAKYDRITEKKWESCRGLGYSFGYNQAEGPEHVIASDKLIELLVDIVSKNGNLLLNIGPKPDGTISDIQTDRLKALGAWLDVNGEGIFATEPWVRPAASSEESGEIRFTRKGDSVYAFLFRRPASGEVRIPRVIASDAMKVTVVGSGESLGYRQQGADLMVKAPAKAVGPYAVALKMTPAPWQVARD
jgi:alpha-L-fucosidase